MKKYIFILLFICFAYPLGAGVIDLSCSLNGKKLYGRGKVVDVFADFRVQKVSAFPDLKVKETPFPQSCGEWQFVDAFPDFTIEYVDAFPDFTIEYVDAFPGI